MGDMLTTCMHAKRSWFNDQTGDENFVEHRPTTGKPTYSAVLKVITTFGVRRVAPWGKAAPYVSESLDPYQDLLNKYLAANVVLAFHSHLL